MTSEIQRQRHIELEGTTNLRNLGGYHTIDGSKTTKWGALYRSDHLTDIPADKAQSVLVDQLHIHDAYDLRAHKEVVARNYNIPHILRHCVTIDPTRIAEFMQRGEDLSKAQTVFRAMLAVYKQMVTDYGKTVGSIIKGLLKSNVSADNAAVIHCTAGKDRTGWTVYLILSLLNISEEEKRADYLLTNKCYRLPGGMISQTNAVKPDEEAKKTLASVCDGFLDAAIEELKKLGGAEVYAKSHMGLTDAEVEKLRALLLEPVESHN